MKTSNVFDMVRQVIADAREKIASPGDRAESDAVAEKTASQHRPNGARAQAGHGLDLLAHAEKIAQACDYLAGNIHLVADTRSPQEKLAEYAAIHDELAKAAFEVGNGSPPEPGSGMHTDTGNKGSHQTTKAPGDSQSPMHPGTDTSGTGIGGPGTSMHAMANEASGGSILQGGDSGEAAGEKPSMSIQPNEKPTPTQAGNALETNFTSPPGGTTPWPDAGPAKQAMAKKLAGLVAAGHIRKEAAAVLIKQAFSKKAGMKKQALIPGAIAGALTEEPGHRWGGAGYGALGSIPGSIVGALPGALAGNPGLAHLGATAGGIGGGHLLAKHVRDQRMAQEAQKEAAMKLAQASGAPKGIASALLKKFAEDALNPAQISAGTTPELQAAPGYSSALSQGAEAGQNTPNTRGDTVGRDLIASNEAAINATKRDAKHSKTQSGMAPYINEPAMSAAHDNVLSKALDNTSSAGVKIAADSARAMLERWASQSPRNLEKLSASIKKANEAMGMGGAPGGAGMPPAGGTAPMAPPAAGGGGPMPGAGMGMNKLQAAEEAEEPPVSDQALAAAAEGVTPEELAMAMEMLEATEGGDEVEGAAMPPAGLAEAPASPQAGGEQPPAA